MDTDRIQTFGCVCVWGGGGVHNKTADFEKKTF